MSQTVLLPYAGGFDWQAALRFLGRRAIDGVEAVAGDTYVRTIQLGEAIGSVVVGHDAAAHALVGSIPDPGFDLDEVSRRLRSIFDLDADCATIDSCLAGDPAMAPLVKARPAMRVFHGWDGFEVAMRTIVGQQVSVGRARDLNGVLVDRCGTVMTSTQRPLRRLFPTAAQVLSGDLDRLGMPGARAATLKTMARAAIDDPRLFVRGASIEETVARLRAVKGVGDWTAHYVAMRACGDPDAFPSSDVGLLRGAAGLDGRRPTPRELLDRAEAWRPWRAYAAHHLWATDPM